MANIKAILLDSDFTGEEKDIEVKSGFCKVDISKDEKHEFFMDKSRPVKVIYRKNPLKSGSYDFYMLSWKSLIPLEFSVKEKFIRNDEGIDEKLKKEGISEKEIKKIKKNIEKQEKKKGAKIERFVFRQLVPVEIHKKHWSKTELPTIVRDTGEMRFLKALKSYTEGGGRGFGIGGKGLVLGFMILFMVLMIVYSMFVAGVFG